MTPHGALRSLRALSTAVLLVAFTLLVLLADHALLAQDDNTALALAEEAAERGDMAEVRRLLSNAFGPETASLAAAPPPRASQALLTVATAPGERTYELRLLPTGDPALEATMPLPLLAEAAAALEAIAPAELSADRLALRIPFGDTAGLLEMQARLHSVLPAEPELALLAAALTPAALEWRVDALTFAQSVTYREEVNLGPVSAACEARAGILAAATSSAAAAGSRLAAVQARLWAADAASWRAFCARSHAIYQVQLSPERPVRRWQAPAGTSRLLVATARLWRREWLAGLATAVAAVIVLFVAALWRTSEGQAERVTEQAEQTEL